MLEQLLEISEGQTYLDGWVNYKCPFCRGRSRPILNIKVEVGYLVVHCFSTACEMHGHRRFKTKVSQEDLKNALENKSITLDSYNRVYNVRLQSIPTKFLNYLDQYYIGKELIDKHGISYCKYNKDPWIEDRLIIPTEDGFLSRSLECTPKWKNFTNKPFVIVCKNTHYGTDIGLMRGTLYIVEDPLSCIRLGEFVDCMALLGTNIKPEYLTCIVKYDKVKLWLDPDSAGYKALLKVGSKLSAYVNVEYVTQDREPKEIRSFELHDLIRD